MRVPTKSMVAAVLGVGLATSATSSAEQVWKLGHINATDSSYLQTVKTIPERIAKATGGEIKIELNHSLV